MEIKIKRQELIQAINNLEIVEKLPRNVIEEFCKVFKIGQGSYEPQILIKGFQNKIADIFCQEGEAYEDYLQLPKFRAMGNELNDKLNTLFKKVWDEYHQHRHREQQVKVKKELEELIPNFSNFKQGQLFHLGFLQLYKQSGLCPRKKIKTEKGEQEVKTSQQTQHFPPSGMNPHHPMNAPIGGNMFSYFPFPPQSGPFPKVEAQEGMGYIIENKQQPLFQVPRFSMQPPFYAQSQQEFFPGQSKVPFAEKGENSLFCHAPSYPQNVFGEDFLPFMIQKFKGYEFVHCVCQGKKGPQENPSFRCKMCNFSFHYSCLRLDGNKNTFLNCPICNLTRETIFCTVVKQPLKFCWYFQEKYAKEFKLVMTEEESTQIYDARSNGLDCQIRFLKIDGKTFKRDKKPFEGFVQTNGILQRELKHSQITLPDLAQDQAQPISLEIMLRSDEDQDSSAKLYFFAVFLIRMRKPEEIVIELFQSNQCFQDDYYKEFMDKSGKIMVSLVEKGPMGGLIKYPVRGADCKHPDVFDFRRFLDKVNDLNQDKQALLTCQICSQPCSTFKYDSLIYRHISNFAEYEDKQPEAIQICSNGDIEWVVDDAQNEEQPEQAGDKGSFLSEEEDSQREKSD